MLGPLLPAPGSKSDGDCFALRYAGHDWHDEVLASRAHTIHEVYRGNDNWQLPLLEGNNQMQKYSHGVSLMLERGTNKPSRHWQLASTYAAKLTVRNVLFSSGSDWC